MGKDTKEQDELILLKLRSTGACIRDGYRLYTGNFRRIFRATWLAAVIYAVIAGLLMDFITSLHKYAALASIGFVLINAFISAFGFSLLKAHQENGEIPQGTRWTGFINRKVVVRSMIVLGVVLVISMAYGAIIGGTVMLGHRYLSTIATAVAIVLLFLIMLLTAPGIAMPLFKYPLQDTNIKSFPLRYWGSTLMLLIVVLLFSNVLIVVTELPAVVLFLANIVSQSGALQGDPTGMPDYMGWTNIIVFTLAGFIQAYIVLSALFPIYYLYGSTEQQEKERQQLNP